MDHKIKTLEKKLNIRKIKPLTEAVRALLLIRSKLDNKPLDDITREYVRRSTINGDIEASRLSAYCVIKGNTDVNSILSLGV